MAFTQGHALIVGVGQYPSTPALNVRASAGTSTPMTVSDARAVAKVLTDPELCGYPSHQVHVLENPTRANLIAALDGLAGAAGEGDTVFMFYSGHGHHGEDGVYYLTTADTTLTPTRKVAKGAGLSEQDLLARLKQLRAKRVILVFNACHSGEISPVLGDGEELGGTPLPQQAAYALLGTGEGRVIITACRERQYSYVGKGELTIFAQALVDGLRGDGVANQRGFISAFDLYTSLYFSVDETVQSTIAAEIRKRYSERQEPELTILKGVGPFAVSLFKGATVLGEIDAAAPPPAGTAVREVSAQRSQVALAQSINVTQSGGINFGVGNQIGSIGDVITGDKFGGDKVAGDKSSLSGNFSGAAVNVSSSLSNVNQTIQGGGAGAASPEDELLALIDRLKATLAGAPDSHRAAAETAARRAQSLADIVGEPEPDKPLLAATAASLKKAVDAIADVLPAAGATAAQISALVGGLAG